jgi:hypothetical protein
MHLHSDNPYWMIADLPWIARYAMQNKPAFPFLPRHSGSGFLQLLQIPNKRHFSR